MPVLTRFPPTAASNQLIVAVSDAVKFTFPVPHLETLLVTGEAVTALMTAFTLTRTLGQTPEACTK